MIQQMLAIWSLVSLPFLNPTCTSGSSQFKYCWSLALRFLSIVLLTCEMSAVVQQFEHSLALPFFVYFLGCHRSSKWAIIISRIYCEEKSLLQKLYLLLVHNGGSQGKASACIVGDQVRSPVREDPLGKEMATHSSILAWKIPWTEKPDRLQSMGSQRVRLSDFTSYIKQITRTYCSSQGTLLNTL